MARTLAQLPAGSRVTDYISLGVIAKFFPAEKIHEVLAQTHRASVRERDLPAHVVVYYVIALALYMRSSYREVLRCLLEGVQWLLNPSAKVRVAGKSGISQARSRLGAEPLQRLYSALVAPIAEPHTKGAWYRHWRLVSLDGSTLDVADTEENQQAFGRPGASRGASAFPKLRFVALLENGTHVLWAAHMDCEWLRDLHSVGLLSPSFRPAAEIVALRAYSRQRATLVEQAAGHIQRMQKSLTQMNLMLHLVLSDITGATGLKIVRSILDGERHPASLAAHRDQRCKASPQEIIAALTGNYRAEHLFTLKQNFAAYEFDCKQIAECDSAIQQLLDTLADQQPAPTTELPSARRPAKPKRHEPAFDIRTPLHRLTGGADLSQIDGIGPHAALQLVAEIGTDMSRWPSAAHFTSWLSLAPNNKISGGRLLSSRTQPSANRAAAVLRRCAMSLMRTATALGAFYRRLAARTCKPTAITATARKLALLVYRVLRGDITYCDPGAVAYAQLHRTRILKALCKRAHQLGHALVDLSTGEILPAHGVS